MLHYIICKPIIWRPCGNFSNSFYMCSIMVYWIITKKKSPLHQRIFLSEHWKSWNYNRNLFCRLWKGTGEASDEEHTFFETWKKLVISDRRIYLYHQWLILLLLFQDYIDQFKIITKILYFLHSLMWISFFFSFCTFKILIRSKVIALQKFQVFEKTWIYRYTDVYKLIYIYSIF